MIARRRDRARRDEAKLERRQAILDAAWDMFQSMPYQSITMADVAAKTQLAKGTIYLYFKTKEELFLQIEQILLEAWFAEVDAELARQRDPEVKEPASGLARQRDPEAKEAASRLADYLSASLGQRPGLVRLLAMLHSILEQNIDFEAALSFKQMLVRRMTRTGALLEARLGFLAAGEGMLLLLRIHALIVGLHSLSDPVPVAVEVMLEPGMDVLAIDFNREFSETLKALLRGMENGKNG